MVETEKSVFGPNFKVRCGVCMEQSGWVTMEDSNAWWVEHAHDTHHTSMAKFIRKIDSNRGPR